MQVLICPDKFKGTLTADEAARAMGRGWHAVRRGDRLVRVPVSDGGDGFGVLMAGLLGARPRRVPACNAAHQPVRATWWWQAAARTAIIEAARFNGLAMLPPGQYHPFTLDTAGVGDALQAAHRAGARRVLMGIGGSATNDAGFGLARRLGWRFLDRTGGEITAWPGLIDLGRILPPRRRRWFTRLSVAVDVTNPLLGAKGCSRIYGPQKGLTGADVPRAEAALRRLARVVREQLGLDHARDPGAGAAGGLGYGLQVFAGARLESGFHLVARQAGLPARIAAADLVITGEGALDRQTLMGKGVGEIARLCRQHGVPCLGLAGVVEDPRRARQVFTHTAALQDLTDAAQARRHAAHWLARLAAREAAAWPASA